MDSTAVLVHASLLSGSPCTAVRFFRPKVLVRSFLTGQGSNCGRFLPDKGPFFVRCAPSLRMSEQGGSGRSDDMGSAASLSSGEEDADDWDDELGDIDDLSDPESDLEDSRELLCVLYVLAFRHLHEVGPLSATATTSRSSRCHCGSCTGEAGVPGQLCPQAHHSRIGIHQGLAQLSSQCRVC